MGHKYFYKLFYENLHNIEVFLKNTVNNEYYIIFFRFI